jgi:hypothetical protein
LTAGNFWIEGVNSRQNGSLKARVVIIRSAINQYVILLPYSGAINISLEKQETDMKPKSILATIAPLFLCLFLISPTQATTADPVAASVALAVRRLQALVPARVDKYTTMISVQAVGRLVKYGFKLNTLKQHIPPKWYSLQRKVLTDKACQQPVVRKLMKEGASYLYTYTDRNNRFVTNFRVRDAECPRGQ